MAVQFKNKEIEAWLAERGEPRTAAKDVITRYSWLLSGTPLPLPERAICEALNGVTLHHELSVAKQIFQASAMAHVAQAELETLRELTDLQFLACLDWFEARRHGT